LAYPSAGRSSRHTAAAFGLSREKAEEPRFGLLSRERRQQMSSSEDRLVHLVDDDAGIRRSVGFMLKTSGHRVETYEYGMDLLKKSGNLDE
jgi:hypothetical protein